jgi:WD40 repeat protein/predicted Ser/Thr protein kinase
MTEEFSDLVQALFHRAVELPPKERTAFLDNACRDNPALRAEIESLLAYDDQIHTDADSGLLESPLLREPDVTSIGDISSPLPKWSAIPGRIGHYRVLRCLGEGGMGIVYEAEQDNPRRPVALKVIRPGLVSLALLKRFTQEAQILGRLHHPGIAQIYEAGVGEDGRPFFAMEFIRGLPLDEYARRHLRDPAARLGLVAQVCDAIQHAHEQGIIHRDLKPSNILVEETGQPKVLDFGVARATDADLQTAGGRTQTGQLLGTPCYMSPEQLTGDHAVLDRRSDVYALGVILFELLADRRPYHVDDLPLPEVARVIREEEPTRLGSTNALCRGDVETIVAKALEKDKARRYASAGELAADIRRHLNHEPILARPPSALYQMQKFVRRHKGLVVGVLAVMAALVVGLIGTILFAVEAGRNAQAAREKEKEARYQTYRARVAAAAAALAGHDVVDAARQLEEAPEELRGWEWHHLHSRLDDSSAAVIPMASNEAIYLTRTPHEMKVVGYTDTHVRLLDLDGRELLSQAHPRLANLRFLGLRSGGKLGLFVGQVGDTAQLVDEEGQVRALLPGVDDNALGEMWLSPDASWLVAVGNAKEAAILPRDAGAEKLAVTRVHCSSFAWNAAFNPDNSLFAAGCEDGVVRIWETATGKLTKECRGHRLKVLGIAFRPDGRRLVTASADGSVRQWNPETGREVAPPYERHTGEVTTVVYSPDGAWVASGSTDRTVRVWDAADRHEVAVLHGHTGFVSELRYSPDGRQVISVGAYFGAFGLGKAGVGDCSVRLWEVQPRAGLPVLRGHTSYVYPVAYSPDGQWIASGSWDRTVCLWDAVTGELAATPFEQEGIVRNLAFSPDSSWLVSTSDEGDRLRVWDVATGGRHKSLTGPEAIVMGLAVSPDGARIATSSRDKVRVLEEATGREVAAWPASADWEEKRALAYSPDGRLLAGTRKDLNVIDIWDAQTFEQTARLVGHTAPVFVVAFSPDGLRLASVGHDRIVRVWDVTTGECVAELRGHTDQVFALAFHPDGTRLASAGRDRAVWLWDLATGQEVARLQGHTNYVFSLAFSPDGKTLVSGSGDGTVRLWDTEPLRKRYKARSESEALRPEAEELVERLFRQKKKAAAVVAALRTDNTMSEPLRHAAMRAVLRRGNE